MKALPDTHSILVTGANGQLGHCFRQMLPPAQGCRFIFATSQDLDITDKKAVTLYFQKNPSIRWVINCAAYTAVDKAESEPEKADRINARGVKNLATAAAAYHAMLFHFSSDYVFHSQQNVPFREEDPVRPKGVYARSKLKGEKAALRAHPAGAMIIRTSWVYAPHGHNFVKTMLRLAADRAEVRVVADQIGSPTYAPDLAQAVVELIRKVEQAEVSPSSLAGVWHYSNEGVASWYDFAAAIFELKAPGCRAIPIETSDYPTPAMRPPFSVLNKSKIKAAFGLEIPHWRQSLKRCLELL